MEELSSMLDNVSVSKTDCSRYAHLIDMKELTIQMMYNLSIRDNNIHKIINFNEMLIYQNMLNCYSYPNELHGIVDIIRTKLDETVRSTDYMYIVINSNMIYDLIYTLLETIHVYESEEESRLGPYKSSLRDTVSNFIGRI